VTDIKSFFRGSYHRVTVATGRANRPSSCW